MTDDERLLLGMIAGSLSWLLKVYEDTSAIPVDCQEAQARREALIEAVAKVMQQGRAEAPER